METLEKLIRKKTKSNSNSPRDDSESKKEAIPRLKISSRGSGSNRDESPSKRVTCPRCKMANNIVLGRWKERDADVHLCGTAYPDDRACRNVWVPEFSYVKIMEAKITYLPGLEGDYDVSFTFSE